LSLLLLLFLLSLAVRTDTTILSGELFGVSSFTWFILAVLSPIIHQIYVLITWRSELYFKGITGLFGTKGFQLFKLGFAVLILSRPVTIILLGFANSGSLKMNTTFTYIASTLLVLPVTSNAMYVYAFLGLYIPGLLLQSKAALLVALFNHIYIWVHYYCTELPDIREIYGSN